MTKHGNELLPKLRGSAGVQERAFQRSNLHPLIGKVSLCRNNFLPRIDMDCDQFGKEFEHSNNFGCL